MSDWFDLVFTTLAWLGVALLVLVLIVAISLGICLGLGMSNYF